MWGLEITGANNGRGSYGGSPQMSSLMACLLTHTHILHRCCAQQADLYLHHKYGEEEQQAQESTPAVWCIGIGFLPHFSTAVITATAQAEAESHEGHDHHEQQADDCTYQEADFVLQNLKERHAR